MKLPFELPEYPKKVDIGSPEIGYLRRVEVKLSLSLGEKKAIENIVAPAEEEYRDNYKKVALELQKGSKGRDLLSHGKTISKALKDGDVDALSLYIPNESQEMVSKLKASHERKQEVQRDAYALIAFRRMPATEDFVPNDVTLADLENVPEALKSQASIFAQFESGGATLKKIKGGTFLWEPDEDDSNTKGFNDSAVDESEELELEAKKS